ncbi:phosphoribosylformylglycinamidine synthase II [Actinomadura rupiterrae]|nr:phosphoribosylformylglycinamidine synthase II [Actinomadura rupiterrae]
MSEQRPDKSGAAHEEATYEWFADLKDDSDDPELQPVDPSVTQAFAAVVDEADAAPSTGPIPGVPGEEGAAADEASDDTPLPPPPTTPDPDLVRAMRDEAADVPVPGLDDQAAAAQQAAAGHSASGPRAAAAASPSASGPLGSGSGPLGVPHGGSGSQAAPVPGASPVPGSDPQAVIFPDPQAAALFAASAANAGEGAPAAQPTFGSAFDSGPQALGQDLGSQAPLGSNPAPQPPVPHAESPLDGGFGSGPQPSYGSGPQVVAASNTGPQPAVGSNTGPQPAVGSNTGPQPAVGSNTGPQPAVNTGPQPTVGSSTGPQPAVGSNTGPQPAVSDDPNAAGQDATAALVAMSNAQQQPGQAGQPGQPGQRDSRPTPVPDQGTDTVEIAARTPDKPQPWAELGMAEDEYRRVRDILGRRPTSAELAIYSVMWSEHCSYKSSKVHLRQFGDKAPQTDALLVGMGENAGVVDVGQGWAVTFKVESHNHPSYVEPYQGAATGVGGIVRDIMSMGARPVAVMDALRFGPADAPDTHRVLPGVVAGIGGYGNSLGLPNIGGETVFDACYAANPLVNALCVGVMKHEDIKLATAPGPGNQVILFGAMTGPDGIGGASVLASANFDDASQAKRPSVQVGDPFMEKLLIECCLELFRADLVVGIQDLGAAGVSCATTELAAAGTGGMDVDLDAVPLRDQTLRPEEILMSESQERMMAVVEPAKVDDFLAICGKYEIPATVIGVVTDTGRLTMTWRGEKIVDIPPGTAADEGPVYERPIAPPADLAAIQSDTPGRLTRPSSGDEIRRTVLWLAGSPNLASKTWVTSQYDRYVLGNTVLAMPEDAGVVRIDDASGLGIALSLDGNGRYTRLDPYAGAQLALSEAYRNVAATGARPLAVTNCLNFGSPEDPGVMWQFAQAVTGLADACQYLGTPVTGGNVSFYNQTGDQAINPTPVIGVLGVHDDVRRRVNMAFVSEGATLALLGETREEFGGSEWAHVVYGHMGGLPPKVDLAAETALASVLVTAAREGLLSAAHDLSDGGLSQALVESCLRGGLGARITLHGDPFVQLFSESVARAVVAIRPGSESRVAALCEQYGVPVSQIGVAGGDSLTVTGGDQQEVFSISLAELREAHERTLPSYAS